MMLKIWRHSLLNRLTLILFYSALSTAIFCQKEQIKKVLFIGNSYTYFWNMPQTVHIMSEKDSFILDTRQSTGGGMSLRQHWNEENDLQTIEIIKKNKFDIIVLQDHSLQAINKPDSLHFFGKLFSDLILQNGAKTYLYITWARENEPDKQQVITTEYEKLAKETGATVVPVGPVWEKVRNLRKDIDLFDKDGSHPSPAGAYLTACVFYSVLSEKSPIGLPARILTKDRNNEKLFLNIQPDKDAKFFQEIVEDMVIKH